MTNIMTIDLEEWFHANYHEGIFDNNKIYEVRVLENTIKLLDFFEKYNVKATFFVLGYVAEKHPGLIKDVYARGHEIASHGCSHSLVYKQTPAEFKEDVHKSKQLLENITLAELKGYRAPSWSITKQSLWALDILQEEGFKYDSSIFPANTFLYGIADAPRFKYDLSHYSKELRLLEIPPSTVRFLKRTMGFSGGFYFRFFPYWAIKYFSKNVNRINGQPVIFYFHPREIDYKQPRLKLSCLEHFIHYFNLKHNEEKLALLLSNFCLESIERHYGI